MSGPLPSTVSASGPAPRRFQYGLKGLFVLTAVAAGTAALASAVSTVTMVAIVWFALLVLAHVAGNAWGTRQRLIARTPSELDEGPPRVAPRVDQVAQARLGRHAKFGRSMVFTVTAAAVAGLAAGALFVVGGVPHWNIYGLLVASISAAVLGGVLGFLLSGCVRVLAQAVLEASGAAPAAPSQE